MGSVRHITKGLDGPILYELHLLREIKKPVLVIETKKVKYFGDKCQSPRHQKDEAMAESRARWKLIVTFDLRNKEETWLLR